MNRKKKAVVPGKDKRREKYLENLSSKSSADLLQEIDSYMKMSEVKGFDFDPDYIDIRLSILQERDPVEIDFNPDLEIHKLPLDVETALHGDRSPKRYVNTWRIIEIAAALILLMAIAVGAGGFNIFDLLQKESAETIKISEPNSGDMFVHFDAVSGEEEYESLQDALDAYEISTTICPSWIPEDYHAVSIDVIANEDVIRFVAGYKSEARGTISIQFTKFQSSGTLVTSEVEPEGERYKHNGVEYYLVSNLDQYKCHWSQDGFTCTINGNLSIDELKAMIDSIK